MKKLSFLSCSFAFLIVSCSVGSTVSSTNNNALALDSLTKHNPSYKQTLNSIYTGNSLPDSTYGDCSAAYREESLLTPPKPQCEWRNSSTQIASDCIVTTNSDNSLGATLARSIVGIAIPVIVNDSVTWDLNCSGTIISESLVLTAGHCVAYSNGESAGDFFLSINNYPVYVLPWQANNYNGVPIQFNNESLLEKYQVDAIYISYDFAHRSTLSDLYYINQDFALLHLKNNLPAKYKPIPIESQSIPRYSQVWQAGYGDNKNQIIDGQLRYHDARYYSDTYESNDPFLLRGTNYGHIYTLGSVPEKVNGVWSAWSFPSHGDSGGPVLYYDLNHNSFSILATISTSMYCSYPGFRAPLPYPYDVNISMPYYYESIIAITNGSASSFATKCISTSGACPLHNINDFSYIVNPNGFINMYLQSTLGASGFKNIQTLPEPILMVSDPQKNHLYVANQKAISMYNIESNGTLSALNPPQVKTNGGAADIVFDQSGQYAYVIDDLNEEVSIFSKNINGSLKLTDTIPVDAPASITITPDNQFVYIASQENKIYIYHRESATGILRPSNPTPYITTPLEPTKISIDPQGKYAYIIQDKKVSVYKIVVSTGVLEHAVDYAIINAKQIIFAVLANKTYAYIATSDRNNTINTYNVKNGTGELIPLNSQTTAYNTEHGMIAFDLDKNTLYQTFPYENLIVAYPVAPTSGLLGNGQSINLKYSATNILFIQKPATQISSGT